MFRRPVRQHVNGSPWCSGALAGGWATRFGQGVELAVRNEDLADEANVTVFTASRFLNEWQREGILVKTRGKIVLRSPQALLRG